MNPTPTPEVERYRIKMGQFASSPEDGNNGAFLLPGCSCSRLFVIAADGMGWEHVSVSCLDADRCPTWDEMCYVKDLFWAEEEVVIQYHPKKSEYINNHPFVLHLWKPIYEGVIPTPPPLLVGIKV